MLVQLDTKNSDVILNCQCTQDAIGLLLEVKRFINAELTRDRAIRGSAYQLASETQQMLELYLESHDGKPENKTIP